LRESKAELTDRLRRDGRFEAFKKRREELKANGTPAKQAWYQAATEFPPPAPVAPVERGNAPKADLRPLQCKPAIPVVQAAAWASEHLDDDWITPADAPSAGAWSMREWARSNMSARSEFYKTFVAKLVMPPQEAARREKEENDAQHREFMQRVFGHLDSPKPVEPQMAEAEEKEAIRQMQIRLGEIPG